MRHLGSIFGRRLLALLLILAVSAVFASSAGAQTDSVAQSDTLLGTWYGEIEVGPQGLGVYFTIEESAGEELSGQMDIPDQGASGLSISEVRTAGDSLVLIVETVGGRFEGRLRADSLLVEGAWYQSGRSWPLTLRPVAEDEQPAGPNRPQEPEPPLPYASEEVQFTNEADGIELAGTLTLPEGAGPHPAAIFISGSGPQNRNYDGTFSHRTPLVLADYLTRQGIAVLRYDDRGVGASAGNFAAATTEDLARDAEAALRYLRARVEVAPGRVGLIGHSEGGIVAPMVAQAAPADFLVLLAGPAVNGKEILVDQAVRMTRAQGAPESRIDSLRRIQDRLLTAVIEAPDSAAAAEAARAQLEKIGVDSASIAAQVRSLTSPWMMRFLTLDPAPLLRAVEVPVLALYGGKDLQVSDELNAERMRELLAAEDDPKARVRVFENANHLFQPAQTGLPTEYAQIETTIDPDVLEAIATFIREVGSGE